MNYEKRLKEALNSNNTSFNVKCWIKNHFPELVENEDLKIKSDIQYAVRCAYGDNSSKTESILAWIEKQGKKKSTDDLTQQEAMDIAVAKCFEQSEQKPADVEPMFKAGNWYLCVKDFYGKGVRFDKGNTYHCGRDGCLQQFDSGAHIFIVEELYEYFRLWTIQDANDGDVLACESGWTCIFKKLNHNSFGGLLFDSYCFIDRTGWFCDGAEGHTLDERINGKIYPATKEQRDTLERAMTNAGYRWNKEELKLEKI